MADKEYATNRLVFLVAVAIFVALSTCVLALNSQIRELQRRIAVLEQKQK